MEKKELKGLPTLKQEDSVTIWKMNYGFFADMSEATASVSVDMLGKKKIDIDSKKVKLNYLVYGVFEAPCLGIPAIQNIGLGLSDAEVNQRLAIVRNLDRELAEEIYGEIIKMNTPAKSAKESEELKKE